MIVTVSSKEAWMLLVNPEASSIKPQQNVDHVYNYQKIPGVPAWVSNNLPGKVWDEITYPFLNYNGCTVEG